MAQAKESTTLLRYRELSFSQKLYLYLAIFRLSEHLDHSQNKKPDSAPEVIWRYKQKAPTGVERILLVNFLLKPWSFLGESNNMQRLGLTESFQILKENVATELNNLTKDTWAAGGHKRFDISFIFKAGAASHPLDLISKLANCAWPKHRFDSLRSALDKTSNSLKHLNRNTVRSLETGIEKTFCTLQKLAANHPSLRTAFDRPFAQDLQLFSGGLGGLAQAKNCLPKVVDFFHGNFSVSFFASHAHQALKAQRLSITVLEQKQNGNSKERPLKTYESHFIIGKLEEALFGVQLPNLLPYVDECPAIKKQIQREKEYRETHSPI